MRKLDRFGLLLKIHNDGLFLPTLALALLRGVTADRKMQYRGLISRSGINLTFVVGLSRPCAKDSTWVCQLKDFCFTDEIKKRTCRN